jgi:hypothetical protein
MSQPVCPPVVLLTDMDVRKLLSPVLIAWCAEEGSGPSRVALDIGVEEKTVRRARDKETSLKANTTFNMLARKGEALDPILAHFRRRSVAIDDVTIDATRVPCDVAACLPLLIDLLRDGDCSDDDTRKLDAAGVIDRLAAAADLLRGRRETLKLKVVRS